MNNSLIGRKGNNELTSFVQEHHYSFLLSWRIRKGLEKGVELQRIKQYTDWFFKNYIESHLDEEEKYVFPILGFEHELVKKSMRKHRRLRRLFSEKTNLVKNLNQIEEELDRDLRFEERELFKAIQKQASSEELREIEKKRTKKEFVDNEEDIFWEK